MNPVPEYLFIDPHMAFAQTVHIALVESRRCRRNLALFGKGQLALGFDLVSDRLGEIPNEVRAISLCQIPR